MGGGDTGTPVSSIGGRKGALPAKLLGEGLRLKRGVPKGGGEKTVQPSAGKSGKYPRSWGYTRVCLVVRKPKTPGMVTAKGQRPKKTYGIWGREKRVNP